MSALYETTHREHEHIRIYVWDSVVRVTHWVVALSIVVLAATGLYIAHPFAARGFLIMGWAHAVHLWAATTFTVAIIARILWLFEGPQYARWKEFIPSTRERLIDLFKTVGFYGLIFRKPPVTVGHNPLAGISYAAIFGVYLLLIATGYGMYAAGDSTSWLHGLRHLLVLFGGLQAARWIHHALMWIVVLFTLSHLYTATLTSEVERNGELDSIFSGNKYFEPRDLAEADDKPEPKS